jgi:predicted nucleic acid-binding protein
MIFVLDTNVISSLRKKRPHPGLARWIAATDSQDLRTTVVTITEIQRGIERVRAQNDALAQEIEGWLDTLLAASEPNVPTMDVEASRLLGKMYETPTLRHFITTDPSARDQATGADLATAAIAITAGYAVATANTHHFLQIHQAFPLTGLFNPFDQTWYVEPAPAPYASTSA